MSIRVDNNNIRFENMPPLLPLTKKSEKTLSLTFFEGNGLLGGAKTYNDLAQRTKKFSDLQADLRKTGEKLPQVESREKLKKALAIAACIAVAMLIVGVVAAIVTWGAIYFPPLAMGGFIGVACGVVACVAGGGMVTVPPAFGAIWFTKKAFTEKRALLNKKAATEAEIALLQNQQQKPSSSSKRKFENLLLKIDQYIERLKTKLSALEEITDQDEALSTDAILVKDLGEARVELVKLRQEVDARFS